MQNFYFRVLYSSFPLRSFLGILSKALEKCSFTNSSDGRHFSKSIIFAYTYCVFNNHVLVIIAHFSTHRTTKITSYIASSIKANHRGPFAIGRLVVCWFPSLSRPTFRILILDPAFFAVVDIHDRLINWIFLRLFFFLFVYRRVSTVAIDRRTWAPMWCNLTRGELRRHFCFSPISWIPVQSAA